MSGDPITTIVTGRFAPTETGLPFSCPIQSLIVAPSLAGRERDLLRSIGLDRSLAIVADANTHDALGSRIASALPHASVVILDAPKADQACVDDLLETCRHADALIAVGAGTINDLVKFASHLRQSPCAVFATAPSMNGFVTATASISQDGEKLSLRATPPRGAFFDLGVLAAAPKRLILAGVGDSLCRSTAELDWRLSHALFDTPFLETPFAIQAADEAALLARIDELADGKLDAMEALVQLLVLGGLGMLIAGNSHPGSQGEHLISHYVDMLCRPHPGSLHGEQVGVATCTMAALQQGILARDRPPTLVDALPDPAAMTVRFGPLAAAFEKALRSKTPTADRLDALNRRLETIWPGLRATLNARALSPFRLRAAFEAVGVATRPEDLGIPEPFYREAVLHARELRERYTMLDFGAMAGLLTPFVDEHLSRPV